MADDLGVLYTDKELRDMERTISRLYTQAGKDIEEKLADFTASTEKQENAYAEKVKNGTMTQEAFDKWKAESVFRGKQWTDKMSQVSAVLANTNTVANNLLRDKQIGVFAMNSNYAAYDIEHGFGVSFGFDLYDQTTVARLLKDKPNILPFKKLDKKKDVRWNFKNIRSQVTQGIIQGESIPKIAERLASVVPDRNEKQMVLHARTAMTAAQNGGRMERFKEAEALGIKFKKVWMATFDGRTRDLHVDLDGEAVDPDEEFEIDGYAVMYPGDPYGEPEMVYNCRCTMGTELVDYPRSSFSRFTTDDGEVIEWMTYREWEKAKKSPSATQSIVQRVAEGEDISGTWERRPDEFDFEIEDVINAQGFDGLPRVVPADEFDELVKQANGGEGFIAQRSYSATDQETLDSYRDQLYNGKWYVDCSTGGAQYGQGMYCAADYTGTLSDGIKAEMEHYREIGENRAGLHDYRQEISDMKSKEAQDVYDRVISEKTKNFTNDEELVFKCNKLYNGTDEENEKAFEIMRKMSPEERRDFNQKANEILSEAQAKRDDIAWKSVEEYANEKGLKLYAEPVSYTETLTLDPSAKIVEFGDLRNERNNFVNSFEQNEIANATKDMSDIESAMFRYTNAIDTKEDRNLIRDFRDENRSAYRDIMDENRESWKDAYNNIRERTKEYERMNDGSFAAMLGYDAINAEGHGESGSYTVILNRTKCIFKGE